MDLDGGGDGVSTGHSSAVLGSAKAARRHRQTVSPALDRMFMARPHRWALAFLGSEDRLAGAITRQRGVTRGNQARLIQINARRGWSAEAAIAPLAAVRRKITYKPMRRSGRVASGRLPFADGGLALRALPRPGPNP
jgi:hypothetical protein